MKKCNSCKQLLPASNFHKRGIGLQGQCKLCRNAYKKLWYAQPANRRKVIDRVAQDKIKYRMHGGITWVKSLLRNRGRTPKWSTFDHITSEELHTLSLKLVKRLQAHPICPYTGIKLIPGVNIALDHKMPVSRQPELMFSIRNLQWVSKTYNRAKHDMTDQEFYDFCQLIILYSQQKRQG